MELPSKSSTKRARAAPNLVTQVASCVVDGCNSDLTNCRDYHRRHRVCELHSKTPTVTILGQERRFCQQCSKFHSLSEFDDGKRSCRTRLDGHNRRRRKPRQPDTLSLTTGGHFISCLQGSKFAPSSIISSSSLGYCSWPENVKVENDSMHYEGPHHQILKFVDQDGTTYPGSVFHDLRMQPHYLPACGVTSVEFMSSNSSSEYDRQSPSTGINRAIASGRAFSLLSPSSVETTTVNCWTHPTQPEQSTTMQPWIEPESQNHRNATLENTDDAVFHHQGLYRQPNVNGVCSSSHNTTLSFSWE